MGQTLKEILDKRQAAFDAIQALERLQPPLPRITTDDGRLALYIADDAGSVSLVEQHWGSMRYSAGAMDFFCREWIKLRPACLEPQGEAKP